MFRAEYGEFEICFSLKILRFLPKYYVPVTIIIIIITIGGVFAYCSRLDNGRLLSNVRVMDYSSSDDFKIDCKIHKQNNRHDCLYFYVLTYLLSILSCVSTVIYYIRTVEFNLKVQIIISQRPRRASD